ncbi:MAG: hypothetical protein R3E94_02245 [Burkholderiaceae bacterium]
MKYLQSALGLAVYVAIAIGLWLLYVNVLDVDVVFYSAMGCAALAVLLFAGLAWFTPLMGRLGAFEKVQHLGLCVLTGYILAISVPTVIDRSLSFYILEKLQQRGGGIQLARFDEIFTTEYMREHRLVEIRLTEQSASGTIVIDGGCVKLTPKGSRLADFSRYFRQHFLPRKRLLMGQYTDALIDPFSRSDKNPDYLCQ